MRTFTLLALGAILLAAGFALGRATAPGPDFSRFSASTPVGDPTDPVALWGKFADDLRVAGQRILASYPREPAIDRAEALRYLLQQVGFASGAMLMRDTGQPALLRLGATTLNKWGLDAADAKYIGAVVDSAGTYRLHGRLGTARLFAVQLSTQVVPYQAFDEITGDRIVADADGSFELLISQERPADWTGNWLQMDPRATDLLVREYFRDWEAERPGTYYLERLDGEPSSEPLTLAGAAQLLDDTIGQFYLRAPQWQERSKQLVRFVANKVAMQQPEDGLAANYYGPGWFKVREDEALLIEVDPVPAAMWSVQLGNFWWESIDYLGHTASYNDSQVATDPDGRVRFVIAHEDPGLANWLDPAGHTEGMLLFRQLQAQAKMPLEFTLVKLDELQQHLPPEVARASGRDRAASYEMRRRHAAIRWAP